jgi:hypothetical protein
MRSLFETANFSVASEWETVYLIGRDLKRPVVVGDFYGNPSAAAVDPAERWCVIVGCGLIVYRLGPPWLG